MHVDAQCKKTGNVTYLFFTVQEKVLHNIMPIFTFMGANIMRLDDAYSFQIINRTVQMVIPALIHVRLKLKDYLFLLFVIVP